jgi:hypothetical protein
LAGTTGSVALATDLDTTVLTFDAGRLTLAGDATAADATFTLPQKTLMQCIVGYRSVRDALNSPGVTLEGEGGPLLDALFPPQHPYTWSADHF